ncbi:MAG TPA: hypothetical protein VJ746_09280 [Nitrospira sp.]|nr:hypothetical protein [Nitrospira sp.]
MLSKMHGVVLVSALAGAMGGMAASMAMGTPGIAQQSDQTTFKVVRAQEFHLIDAKDRVRGLLAFSADAQPYLQLRDENDVGGVWIGIARETGMSVKDVDGRTRLVLSVDDTGNPSLVVRNREHRTRSFHP